MNQPWQQARALSRTVVVWAVLACAIWLAIARAGRVPRALPAYASATDFSGHRATSFIQQLTTYPHPTGSSGAVLARTDIEQHLMEMGLSPTLQTTTAVGTRYRVAGRVTNILVRVPGTRPNGRAILLMAHYDAVPVSPGAGDDGSGVGTLLETLRALRASAPLRNDVIALFTDGEEAGLLGAAAFVREHPWAKEVAVVMNFEARGTNGPSMMFETGPGNLDVVRVLRRAVRGEARATSLSTAVYRKLPNDTDLSELALLNQPALNFAFIGGVNRYHTSQDDLTHLDVGSLQHHGNQALALARAFGDGELPRPRTSDAVFFDYPVVGLIVYPTSWATALGILVILLSAWVIVRERAVVATGLGVLAAVIAPLLAGTLGFAAGALLQRLHAALESGTPDQSALYAAAVAAGSVAITLAAFALLSPKRGGGAGLGALALWSILALVTSIAAPGSSFVFTWPALVMAAARLVSPNTAAHRVATWAGTLLSVVLIAPLVYVMGYVALGVNAVGAAVIGVLTSLLTALLIETVRWDAARWRPALAAMIMAAVLLVIGAITVRTNAASPAGVSLVYAADADSAGAWLTGYASAGASRQRLRHALRDQQRSSGEAQAQAAPAPSWLRGRFGIGSAPVSRLDLPRSELNLVSDSSVGTERRLTLRFRPAPGVMSVDMFAASGTVLRATVDGRAIGTDRYRGGSRSWSLSYIAPAVDTGFMLGLVLPAASRITLDVSTRTPGMPPLQLPARPEGIIQFQGGNTTLLHFERTL